MFRKISRSESGGRYAELIVISPPTECCSCPFYYPERRQCIIDDEPSKCSYLKIRRQASLDQSGGIISP